MAANNTSLDVVISSTVLCKCIDNSEIITITKLISMTLVQLKQKLQIETIICIDEGNPSKFEQFEFIFDNILKKKNIQNK